MSPTWNVELETIPEPPAGVEPARPPYQDGKLPLHHGGVTDHEPRAPSGSRTRTSAMARQQATATSWARLSTSPTSGSGGNRTHVTLLKRQVPRQRRAHFQSLAAGGGGIEPHRTSRRFWRPSAFPDAITTCVAVPRAGVEPDLGGLKGRRPHRKSNGAHPRPPRRRPARKREPAGGSLRTPGRRDCHCWPARGYPLVSLRPLSRCAGASRPKPASSLAAV